MNVMTFHKLASFEYVATVFLFQGGWVWQQQAVMAVGVFLSIAGGLATGADEVKSAEQRTTFGGLANATLDPCYHRVRRL